MPLLPPPRRVAREDSSSSNSSELRIHPSGPDTSRRGQSGETSLRTETVTSAEVAIDLSKKPLGNPKVRAPFYQETSEVEHRSVITPNPTYATLQPSTSTILKQLQRVPLNNNVAALKTPLTPLTAVAPVLNIDFSKSLEMPEIKVLDSTAAGSQSKTVQRQNSKPQKNVDKKVETKRSAPLMVDMLSAGNLQIDEDYDT